MRRLVWCIATVFLACDGGGAGSVDAAAGDVAFDDTDARAPIEFDCQFEAACPELVVAGDPLSGTNFRGYGDPSLERDPGGALWFSYSWLDEETLPGNPAKLHAVATHLARSDDGGATFQFVRAINATAPSPGNVGLVMHEVSTLARTADGWQDLWLTYALIPTETRVEFHYQRTRATTPEGLGDAIDPYLRGSATDVPTQLTGAGIAGLEDCVVFTEPALFSHDGTTYLATTCIVNPAAPATQRLVLLRESGASLVLVGELLSAADAAELGGTRVEQIDLSIARDGEIIAIVTPILDGSPTPHRGCVVLEIDDLDRARVRRDAAGHLVQRARITGSSDGIGAGLCTYDRDAATGILIDLTTFGTPGSGLVAFSLRATGVHP